MIPLLSCSHLQITDPRGRTLIDDVNITLEPGARTAIMGPSGSGKTTLLHAILNALPPAFTYTGSISLTGEELSRGSRTTQKRVADTISYLPQDAEASLTPTMKIGALLKEALPKGTPSPMQAIERALDAVQLPYEASFLRRRAWQVSGGQQRRVALARALARERPLLVLDEPTSGLDPKTRNQILELLANVSERLSSALLLVTHDRLAAGALHCTVHRLHGSSPTTPTKRQRHVVNRTAGTPALSVHDATINDPSGQAIASGVTLSLLPGTITALRGKSGDGKTTLARAVAGFAPLQSGAVRLHGKKLAQSVRDRTVAQRRAIQLVKQNSHDAFNPRRSIRQSLLDARPITDPAAFLSAVRLTPSLLDRRPHQLSGGQRQRFALIRALSIHPDVLLLDEPTSALDLETALQVFSLIRQVASEGAAILVITHDSSPTGNYFDRHLTLADGALQAERLGELRVIE